MNDRPKTPDAETRKRNVEQLQESNRQLELVGLAMDELLAMAELELCRQRRKRFEKKYQSLAANRSENE